MTTPKGMTHQQWHELVQCADCDGWSWKWHYADDGSDNIVRRKHCNQPDCAAQLPQHD